MDLLKLGRNTKYNTVPLYKLKVGTPIYLWEMQNHNCFEIEKTASLITELGPELGKVVVMYTSGEKKKYPDKSCAVIGEIKK